MSRLYGITSHAALCKLLKKYRKNSFCECCRRRRIRKRKNNNNDVLKKFNHEMFSFLQNHHLSVYAIEKRIQCDGLSGRVDCLFLDNICKNKLYIVDWKFSSYIPVNLQMDHVIQLNLYMYIMKRMKEFMVYTFEMYCIIFSSVDQDKIRIFKSIVLPEKFMENLITRMSF